MKKTDNDELKKAIAELKQLLKETIQILKGEKHE